MTPIESWYGVIFPPDAPKGHPVSDGDPTPVIMIKPTKELKNYLDNNPQPDITIQGAGMLYDGHYTVLAAPAGEFPHPRPYYYAKNGYYAIAIHCPWRGYPSTQGSMSIMEKHTETPEISETPVFHENLTDASKPKNGMSGSVLIIILSVLAVLLVGAIIVSIVARSK